MEIPQPREARTRQPFRVADWRVEPATGHIHRDEKNIKLEPRVMDLLICLASRPGEVFSREELESTVWAGLVVGYDSLSSAIIKLRKAFEDDPRHPKIIETVSKRGYRLIAAVDALEQPPAHQLPANFTPRTWFSPKRLGIYLATFILLIIVGYTERHLSETTTTPPPITDSNTPSDKTSLVVLPFTNSNNDKNQEYFSDGITDDLINDLSRYSGLSVIARRTAYIYKQRQTDIQTIAHELGVKYVLDGDVRRESNTIRMNVQLIDAESGVNIWAQRFVRETEDIFAVQDDIRNNIINALSITLTKEEQSHTPRPSSFAAYDLFLQGQASLITRASAKDSRVAQQLMEQAIQLDPHFARAYAALALIHADAYRFDWTDNPENTRQEALKIGERAIELDDHSPQAYWILGYIYLFLYEDHDKAIAMGKKAIELAPNDMDAANVLAVTYAFGDDPAKAKLIVTDIMQRNQHYSALVPSVLGLANLRLGNYHDALAAYDKSLLINPSRIQGNAYRAIVLYRMGNVDDADFQVDQLYTLHPNFNVQIWAARQPFKDKALVKGLVDDLIHAGVRPD